MYGAFFSKKAVISQCNFVDIAYQKAFLMLSSR